MRENQFFSCYFSYFFAGMIVYAALQYVQFYRKRPQNVTRMILLVTCAAALFIIIDAFVCAVTSARPHEGGRLVLLFVRETIPLLFLFLSPYYLIRICKLGTRARTINRVLFYAGAAASVVIVAVGLAYPDLLVQGRTVVSGGTRRPGYAPLLVARNSLIMIYLVYALVMILVSDLRKKTRYPVRNVVVGLGIACYIAFTHLYVLLFPGPGPESISGGFPYMALAVTVLIVFMSFSVIEWFVKKINRVEALQNNINGTLYLDSELEVPNVAAFRRDLEANLRESHKGDNFSLVFLDIDDFKNINESYGETIGDVILWMLSRRMIDNFTESAVFYRTGGDEFVFMLRDVHSDSEAADFASKILASLRNPFLFSEASYTVTASIAVLMVPRDGDDLDTIMNNVYGTIRSAKKTKNTFMFFNRNLTEGATRKIYAVNLLRTCIAKDEFVLFYQPVVDAEARIVYAEALLRCTSNSPEIGGPGDFIPLIEKAGMMKDLDNLVVRRAFYDMEMKIQKKIGMSINFSADQLCNPVYGDFLSSFAHQHGIEPERLILEITETTLVDNMHQAQESLIRLKESGFQIAIDDFGKGFSSLSYLVELPVDILKIDMAFVQAIPGDDRKEKMAKYIIELGRSLGLKVLAEGFETPEQVEFFKKNGCELFQGYYFSRPLALQELLVKYLT